MRRFLYLSPYFPPMARVGALRPLKFARHLPKHGWAPVVLCDLWRDDPIDPRLAQEIPKDTLVIRNWARGTAASVDAWERGDHPGLRRAAPKKASPSALGRKMTRLADRLRPSPEWIPLGKHAVDMPHARRATRAALDAHPECEAIVVNADPYAAMLVGADVAKERGLPLVQDLRDPWAVCELRRPERPPPQRKLVDRLERSAFARADKVVLNTRTTYEHVRAHYPDLPADRFTYIRNHADPELIAHGEAPSFARFAALFLGNFRRHVEGDVLLRGLARARELGLDADDFALVVTGRVPDAARALALELGVEGMLVDHPRVAYPEIGPVMEASDLLVSLTNDTIQRFPAKVFDYATTARPILNVADNPELVEVLDGVGGTTSVGLDDVEGVARAFVEAQAAGRKARVERDAKELSSARASEKLAAILDEISAS